VITEADAAYGLRALDNGRSEPIAAALAVSDYALRLAVSGWRIPTSCRPHSSGGTSAVHPAFDDARRRDIRTRYSESDTPVRMAWTCRTVHRGHDRGEQTLEVSTDEPGGDPVPPGLVLDLDEAFRVLEALEDARLALRELSAALGLQDELATVIRMLHGRLGLDEGGVL
jgi:hypothetical protein